MEHKKRHYTREFSETDAFDLVNKYGTYNIQDTADTSNLFPLIAHGLPIKELQNKGHKSKTQSNVGERKTKVRAEGKDL